MNLTLASLLVIFLAMVAANLPFLSEKYLGVFTPKVGKVFWQRMLEWAGYGLIVLLSARWLETQINLENYAQTGEFYWVLIIAYLTFAYPGFVYRYLWHKGSGKANAPLDASDEWLDSPSPSQR